MAATRPFWSGQEISRTAVGCMTNSLWFYCFGRSLETPTPCRINMRSTPAVIDGCLNVAIITKSAQKNQKFADAVMKERALAVRIPLKH